MMMVLVHLGLGVARVVTKICSKCGKEYSVGNTFHKLCHACNSDRLRGKSNNLTIIDADDVKVHNIRKLTMNKGIIRSGNTISKHDIVNPLNVSNLKELFLHIWCTQPHVCKHCGANLGDTMIAHFFSHIYPKSIRPWLKYDPDNIELLCIECHTQHDFGKRKFKLI